MVTGGARSSSTGGGGGGRGGGGEGGGVSEVFVRQVWSVRRGEACMVRWLMVVVVVVKSCF